MWATDEYFSGLHASGVVDGHWVCRAGAFSGDDSEEIGLDNVGYFTLLSLGYDFSPDLDMDTALVRLDHVYDSEDEDDQTTDNDDYDNNATPDFRHTASLVTEWQTGLQYTKMADDPDDGGRYSGWGLTTGLRMYS